MTKSSLDVDEGFFAVPARKVKIRSNYDSYCERIGGCARTSAYMPWISGKFIFCHDESLVLNLALLSIRS